MQEEQHSELEDIISSLITKLIKERKIKLFPTYPKWDFSTSFILERKITTDCGSSLDFEPRTYNITWCPTLGEGTTPLTVEIPEGGIFLLDPVGTLKDLLDYIERCYRIHLDCEW